MTKRHKCPKCSYQKAYVIRRGKVRCLRCRYEWRPDRLPLQLETSKWEEILAGFLHDLSAERIAQDTGINRWRVMRALNRARAAMLRDLQEESQVFRLLRRGGKALANLVPEEEAQTRVGSISRQIRRDLAVFSGTRESFSRLAAKAFSYTGGKRFEEYLEKKFSIKRGIRPDRWPLFFGEYAWRYIHRNLTVDQQITEIIRLLKENNLVVFDVEKVS